MGNSRWITATIFSVALLGLTSSALAKDNKPPTKCGGDSKYAYLEVTKLIVMPNAVGHTDWVDSIQKAKRSLHMEMYHITDKAIITALGNLAKVPNIDLEVIVDGGSLTGGYQLAFQELQAAGVNVRASTPAFSLTHTKTMIVDGETAFVTAINMTNTYNNTRDFGIITPDCQVISEMENVFQADWANSVSKGANTPQLSNANLAWSPINADAKLVALINSAKSTLIAETETFSDDDVIAALNSAAARGVNVRLIVPQCVEGNGAYNYQYLAQLQGVNIHVEVDGDSVAQPYMHSKMMLIDGVSIYIGSINYTFNSIQNDREVGALFSNSSVASQLSSEFETDWNRSVAMPATTPTCATSTLKNAELRDMGLVD